MITSNVIDRVFKVQYGDSIGSGFAIDVDGKQYLVTARHVVEGIKCTDKIVTTTNAGLCELQCTLVGKTDKNVDIAVLVLEAQISLKVMALKPTAAGLAFSQQIYFLGFPYEFDGGKHPDGRPTPFPFVKTGIVSAFLDNHEILLDGHNNYGFSGGPVVFIPFGNSVNTTPCVAGIVVSYPASIDPVFDLSGNEIGQYEANTGIVRVSGIQHALGLINSNPIGVEVRH